MNTIGNKIYLYNEVTSAQDVAYNKAMEGEQAGTVVVAESQTEGRGRLGRKWHSPKGGLYVSIILNPELSDKDSKLTLTAAECAARAISSRFKDSKETAIGYRLEAMDKIKTARGYRLGAGGERFCLQPTAYSLQPIIKHPNDVLLNGKKVAGILAEMRDGHLILGIGININTLLKDLPEGATSIFEETGKIVDNKELLDALLKELNHAFSG